MIDNITFTKLPKNTKVAVRYFIGNEIKYIIVHNGKTEIYTLFDVINNCINQKLGSSDNPLTLEQKYIKFD